MGDISIRVSQDAKDRLDLHKRDEESYDDVILRLTSTDKWAGFGVAGGDREGMADLRDSMRESMDRDGDGRARQ